LQAALQQDVQEVVSQYLKDFPNLAVSIAWKDAKHDVAVASGKPATINRDITPKDTFLYGSGTKPFTATAILRLIDQGKVKETDKVSSIVDPYLQKHGKKSLAGFFGSAIANATVLELIRMGSGVRDFEDDFTLDQWVLAPGNSSKFWDYPFEAMSWSVGPQNTKGGGPLYCNPGECTAYSSTGFEVAGLVLAAVLNPSGSWYDFDLGTAITDDRTSYPSMAFPPKGSSATDKLSAYLTVPGQSVASTWPKTTIYEQNPSILGWTCGNMVASPKDVAKFFYHLLDSDVAHTDPQPLISDSSRTQMTDMKKLTTGWNAGKLEYGAGLMALSYGSSRSSRISVLGHEGDTYGFLSSQGYVPSMKAAYSVATNVDNQTPMEAMVRKMLATVESHQSKINSETAVLV
jgi:CubicO group peptidase (beta-lactamase class C family)